MANRQWAFDDEFRTLSESRAAANIKNPVGMVSVKQSAEGTGTKVARSNKELLLKRATELSHSPAKNFMMTGLMLWMTGSGINIFTIMFTVMAMVNPIKSIAGVNQQFQRYSDGGKLDLTQQKFVFVALHLVALGVGLWKCQGLGLLPTTVSDWATFETVARPVQYSSGSFV